MAMPTKALPESGSEIAAPSDQTRGARWLRAAPPLLAVIVFVAALVTLHRLAGDLHLREVLTVVAAIPGSALLLALGLTAASYLSLTFYDVLALRYVSRPLPYRQAALTSFVAYALGHNVGVVAFSAGAIRFRMYSLAGLSAEHIAQVAVFCALTFNLGAGVLLGLSLIGEAGYTATALHASAPLAEVLGALVLGAVGAYLALTLWRRAPISVRGWLFSLPSPGMTLAQIAVAVIDLVLACAALYTLLAPTVDVSFPAFLGLYMVAMVGGSISTVPGGLGVFESLMVMLLPGVGVEHVLGPLLLYRLIYYVAPGSAAVAVLAANELWHQRTHLHEALRWTQRSLDFVVPQAMAILAFASGAVLLLSGATPAVASRVGVLAQILPLPVLELSHLAGSVIGVALLVLARGLYYRLDAAWHLMLWLLGAGIAASLLKGLDYEEALLLVLVLLPLLATRRGFYRRASLLAEPLAPRWLAAVAMVIAASIWIGLLAQREVPYQDELWWQFAFEANAPRMLRASLVAVVGLGVLAAYRLLQPPRPAATLPGAPDLDRARTIIGSCEDVTGNLALLGDKNLMFSQSGRAFVMYAVSGRSWIAMGDPVGPREEHNELVWRFREFCDREGGRCVFYEVTPEDLPIYVDAGLSLSKLGEEARVELSSFSTEGSSRAHLRQALSRARREGASFRVADASEVGSLLPRLREVSEAWLAEKSVAEKGFSLGFFSGNYLGNFPCALVERDGRIVAFANLWLGGQQAAASIDLMRHSGDAPKGVMDFLFIETMLWAKAQGYRWFSLGMAPLAGLEAHRLAPAWHKLGRLLYRYGEDFYNFEGLRHYKEKFQPEWTPRYLAAPSGMALPRVLLDVTALISRGWGRTLSRGRRSG